MRLVGAPSVRAAEDDDDDEEYPSLYTDEEYAELEQAFENYQLDLTLFLQMCGFRL